MIALDSQQQRLVFLLASIGLITLPHVNNIPTPLFVLFTTLLVWRFIAIWKPQWLPNKLILFTLTLAVMGLLFSLHKGFLGRDGGTSLFIAALGLKLLETKNQREIYIVNYLAFFVASTQFLYQQSILMAIYILFVSCVLLATLVTINSHKINTIQALKTAGSVILQALPIAIILFIVFPRIEAPRWSFLEQDNQAMSGLSDSLEPGAISHLGMSDELVFRVKFSGAIPPPSQRYWRGPVYSHTDGKRWTESQNLAFIDDLDKTTFFGQSYSYTLMMEPQNKNWVYALDMAESFPSKLNQNALYQLINNDMLYKRIEYKLSSNTRYNTGQITKIELIDNLQLPKEPSKKIKQLVTNLQGFNQPAEIYIQALLNHFRQQQFYYTLSPPLMGDQPIENFLFNQRYGFCSHYATAFVYLMRVAGIPARVVSGYQGGKMNDLGGFMEVRQANAHAWAEVWLTGKGWSRFDPTAAIAPERIEQDVNIDLQIATGLVNFSAFSGNASKAISWLRQSRQLWRSLDYSWQRWVINYSQKNRSDFFSAVGISNLKIFIYSLIASISVITIFIAWFLLKTKPSTIDEELKIYQRFCKKLAKVGLSKKTGETAQSFSERIKKLKPDHIIQIDNITQKFIKIRYQQDNSKKDFLVLKQMVAQFKP